MKAWQLKEILAKHKDSEEVSIGLNFFDRKNEQTLRPSYVSELEHKLKTAYDLLYKCSSAVQYFAKKEKKEKCNLTYYEGKNGYNGGYIALKKDLDTFIETYSSDMLRLQIENG